MHRPKKQRVKPKRNKNLKKKSFLTHKYCQS